MAQKAGLLTFPVSSQEGQLGTSKSSTEIERETGISQRTVQCIAKFDLQLKAFQRREVQLLSHADRVKRLAACKRLSWRLTIAKLARTLFTDEKIFTVQTPTNSQNVHLTYASVAVKRDAPSERLLKGRKHFSQSIMVSVAVSQLGKSSLVFVEGGAKVSSSYYCDVVLHQGLLPDITCIAHSALWWQFHFSAGWSTCSSFTKTSCFSPCSRFRLYWTRKLATEQSGFESRRLFYLGSASTACLQAENLRYWTFERNSDRMLGRNQPGHYQPGYWKVSQAIIIGYRSKRMKYWTSFWLKFLTH